MKNVIEQIRKIKGVKTVEMAGEGMAVVVFEGNRKPIPVLCDTELQCNFLSKHGVFGVYERPIYCNVIPFLDYIFLHEMMEEWTAFSKPKSLSPDELVDGKIYVDEDNGRILRFNKCNTNGTIRLHSQLYDTFTSKGNFGVWAAGYRTTSSSFRPATPSEAKTLIRAEVANWYFHELKDAK